MAADPLDIVNAARARAALRLTGDDPDHDALLANYITGAAGWAEQLCRMGIVDTGEVRTVAAPACGNAPLTLTSRAPALLNFRWRAADRPGAAFAPASAAGETDGGQLFVVDAPAGGWPAGDLMVAFTRSMPADDVPGTVRNAMLLWVRDAYDLVERIDPERWPALQMLKPYIDAAVGA